MFDRSFATSFETCVAHSDRFAYVDPNSPEYYLFLTYEAPNPLFSTNNTPRIDRACELPIFLFTTFVIGDALP